MQLLAEPQVPFLKVLQVYSLGNNEVDSKFKTFAVKKGVIVATHFNFIVTKLVKTIRLKLFNTQFHDFDRLVLSK